MARECKMGETCLLQPKKEGPSMFCVPLNSQHVELPGTQQALMIVT